MHTPGATPFLLISPTPLSPLGPCPPSLHTLPKHRADRHFRPLQSEHKHKYFAPPLSRRSFHHPEPNTAHTQQEFYISLSAHHYHQSIIARLLLLLLLLLLLHYHSTTSPLVTIIHPIISPTTLPTLPNTQPSIHTNPPNTQWPLPSATTSWFPRTFLHAPAHHQPALCQPSPQRRTEHRQPPTPMSCPGLVCWL